MSEMTDITTRKIFLEICMDIEGLCASLYHFYSTIYEDSPEAVRFWKKVALEEENHQKQFELALRLLNETEFEVSKDNLKRAYAIQFKLQNLMNHIQSHKPDLLTAVSKAIEMEEKLADLHVHTSLNFKDESMQKLFTALGNADMHHVSEMQRYLTVLYLPLSDMEG